MVRMREVFTDRCFFVRRSEKVRKQECLLTWLLGYRYILFDIKIVYCNKLLYICKKR